MEGTLAAFAGPGRPFELRHVEVPAPEPGAIVVRILQANICGSDLHFWQGRIDLVALGRPMPVVLGHEAVGVVEALGDGVETDANGAPLAPGDRVAWRYFQPCGRCRSCTSGRTRACQQNHLFLSQGRSADQPPFFVGPMATHHVIPPGQVVFRVPNGVPNAVAAAANCAVAQAIQTLDVAGLRMGESVVVQGAGGLGLFACAVAKAAGASPVVVLDALPERLELAKAFGADVTLDLTGLPDARSRVRAVRKETDGGADVVCEFVGRPDAVAEGIGMVRPGGRYLECGCVHAGASIPFDPSQVTLLSRTIIGLICYEPWALREALSFLDRTEGPWDRLTPTLYPLSDVDRAFADATAQRVPRATVVPE